MKKLLPILIVFIIFTANVYSQLVDCTVEFVSNNASTGELVFDVFAQTDDLSTTTGINAFYLYLKMNTALSTAYSSASSSSLYFTSGQGYDETLDTIGNPKTLRITYQDSDFTNPTLTLDGTNRLIARITLTYTPGVGTGTLTNDVGNPYTVYNNSFAQIEGTLTINNLADFPLPVELASFSANYEKGNVVSLNWRTESELETEGFHIYRSMDKDGNYECISQELIPAKGSATDAANYSFTDKSVNNNTTYWYQIQEVGIDGQSNFVASTNVITKATPTTMALAQNYPNPFNPDTKIQYELAKDSHVTLEVFNILGKKIATLVDQSQSAGYYSINWNGVDSNLNSTSSGIYFYKLNAAGHTLVKKMTKME